MWRAGDRIVHEVIRQKPDETKLRGSQRESDVVRDDVKFPGIGIGSKCMERHSESNNGS